jgi:hypothetical protein
MLQLTVQYHFDLSSQLVLDRAWRPVSVNRLEPIEFLHGLELHLDLALIFDEAVIHVLGGLHVHPGLPVVQHEVFTQVSLDQNCWTDRQVEHSVWNERYAVYLPNPGGFNSAYNRTGHQCVDITIGQDDEAGPKGWKDAILELIGEISCIEQAQSARAENVSLHGLFEFAADEHRSFQSDVHRWKPPAFEPVA